MYLDDAIRINMPDVPRKVCAMVWVTRLAFAVGAANQHHPIQCYFFAPRICRQITGNEGNGERHRLAIRTAVSHGIEHILHADDIHATKMTVTRAHTKDGQKGKVLPRKLLNEKKD